MIYSLLRDHYYNSDVGYWLISPFKTIFDLFIYRCISEEKILKNRYQRIFKEKLNLDNPQTLNEKLLWLKLNDRTELHTKCADKLAVREFIAEKVGVDILIPLYFRTKSKQEITAEALPDSPMIIKTNHDSGGGYFIYDKKNADWKNIRKQLGRRLRANYYYKTKEWQYKNIIPEILVEKLLLDESGNVPSEYKMHCFNGRVVFTQVDFDRKTNHTRNLYDNNWNLIPCEWLYKNGKELSRPEKYLDMQSIAEKVSACFAYVRVDFYVLNGDIYFGELTFHSDSGFGTFNPPYFDKKFGKQLTINQM